MIRVSGVSKFFGRLQALRQIGGFEFVGKEEFDRVEAIGRGGCEALQEGHFGVHHREVGSESGHVTRGR